MNDQSDIGEKFQKARSKRRLSLQEVAHQTRIPLTTLQALEADDYSGFTSPAYAKSFLTQYSDFLRIHLDEELENFNTGNVVIEPDHIEFLNQNKSATSPRAASGRHTPSSQGSSSSISQPLLILLITGGLLAAGIWGFITVEKRLNATADAEVSDSPPLIKPATPATNKDTASLPATTNNNNNTAGPSPQVVADSPSPLFQGARPPRVISAIPTLSAEDLDAPVYVFPEHKAAPRAIIVNEDDDQ